MEKRKLYCYVDETGQDTKGELFIVVVLIVAEEKDQLEKVLEGVEVTSGKRKRKWIKSREKEKFEYLSLLRNIKQLSQSIFYSEYTNSIDYEQLTVETVKNAINEYIKIYSILEYRATIIIDGLNQ